MASLPTAYAGQRFGRKTLDYYAVEGEVVGADPRARSDERRLQDFDGARHTVRLMESGFRLEPGDTAAVLRMQAGPAQRSRPVAVVNHDTGGWTRTHPGAPGLLARAGVSRSANWALTMALFALAALVLVWPFLRAFLVEVDPALFGAAPSFSAAELAAGWAPALTSWSFADITAPLTAQISGLAPGLAPAAGALVFGVGALIAAVGVYVLRSWRLLWAPLFVLALGVVAIGFGGVAGMTEPGLAGLGLAALVFLSGGMINRIRDAARLESRIAVLADHLLRQGPQEIVAEARDEDPADDGAVAEDAREDGGVETLAPAIAASAVALREPGGEDDASDTAQTAEEAGSAVGADTLDEAETETGGVEASADVDAEESDQPAPSATDAEPAAAAQDDAETAQPEQWDGETPADVGAEPGSAQAGEDHEDSEKGQDSESAPDAERDAAVSSEAADDAARSERSTKVEVEATAPNAELEAGAANAQDTAPDDAAGANESQADAGIEPETPDAGVQASGEAEGPRSELSAATPAGLDPEEAERLRTDPRYASRAIVLPPPPPMPESASGAPTDADGPSKSSAPMAQTLRPSAPLPDNVVPIFAALAPSRDVARPDAGEASKPESDDPEGDDRA